MNDVQQRPILTPDTIPVQPPIVQYMNVVKVPQDVAKPLRWPLYFFIFAVILAGLAAIPFAVPGVGAFLRGYFAKKTDPAPVQQVQQATSTDALTQRTARAIALKAIIEAEGPQKIRSRTETLSIIDARTITTEYGWIFFWNTKKFIESNDVRATIPGTGPVVVTKKGEVEFLATNKSPVETIAEYEYRIGARLTIPVPATTPVSFDTASSTTQ